MNEDLHWKMARIVDSVRGGDVYLTEHAEQKGIERDILESEVLEAILVGTIIEDYPDSYLGPLCLILGHTVTGRSLHVVCSIRPPVAVVTAYEPNLRLWEEDLRTRRRRL